MVPVTSSVLYADAIDCLVAHKRSFGRSYRGRFVQIFIGLKFFQNSIPSMYSGAFASSEVLESQLDELFAKMSRPVADSVLMIFEGSYLARTGVTRPGKASSENTWRNNFNLQKGVGCRAPVADLSSPTFLAQPRSQCKYLVAPTLGSLVGARCSLNTSSAKYRGENHHKWLRIDASGGGYAVTDLQNLPNFASYVAPGGSRIPVLPLIVALYHDADPGLTIGNRPAVSLADFAADFNFSAQEISAYFDVSMSHPLNARLTNSAAWVAGSSLGSSTVVSHGGLPATSIATPAPAAVGQPMLGGTPTPPPSTNNGWDAEQYVASALTAAGWTAHVVSRQQLGYDIFAQRGTQKRYVEVKSSLGLCSPSLTAREWQQASYHANSYVLAILENFNPTVQNVVYWVRDPANQCSATPQTTISHGIARSSWAAAAIPLSNI
jgi:hypothetical protein